MNTRLIKYLLILFGIAILFIVISKPSQATVFGDINGDGEVTGTDLLMLKKHIVGIEGEILSGDELERADVNGDGDVTATDLLVVKKVIIGADDIDIPTPTETSNPTIEPFDSNNDNDDDDDDDDDDDYDDDDDDDVVIEEYVTVRYVSDPNLYPDIEPEDEPWKQKLKAKKRLGKKYEIRITKDISETEIKVLKGSTITITNEKPEFDSITISTPEVELWPDGSICDCRSYLRFSNVWFADKTLETISGDYTNNYNIVNPRMGDKG